VLLQSPPPTKGKNNVSMSRPDPKKHGICQGPMQASPKERGNMQA